MKKITKDEIVQKLQNIYGDNYNYSLVDYSSSKNKIKLICPKHGIFESRIDHLLEGKGCQLCKKEKDLLEKQQYFIDKSNQIHGNKYDYSKVVYINALTKVCIICPIHGEFWQTPSNHLNQKQGCPKCYNETKIGRYKINTEQFIEKAKQVHGEKYDYSKTIYNGLKKKLKIICPIHGEFEQIAYDHLRGFGCEKCKYMKNTFTKESFIERAKQVHGEKYDYSKVEYFNNRTKICIICPIHGEFWQTPLAHLIGCGCQKCNSSKLENEIREILSENHIDFCEQKQFKWLGRQSLDFYIPSKNIAIECQGEQHFKPIDFFGGIENFKNDLDRDLKKFNLCKKNKVKLLYYSNLHIVYPYGVFEDKEELLKQIMEN